MTGVSLFRKIDPCLQLNYACGTGSGFRRQGIELFSIAQAPKVSL
jgi:hypothetical protein